MTGSATREVRSLCRFCAAACGVVLTLDDDDRILAVRGDRDAPLSKGYACFKGLQAGDAHRGDTRLLRPLKRMPDGTFIEIGVEQALDEIADKLREIIDARGPDSVATWTGGGQMLSFSSYMMGDPFRQAIGTNANFTNVTIDQSCKAITADRMGSWGAGKQVFDDSDTVLLIGTNPLIGHATPGTVVSDPVKRMKAATANGLKLVVIDPRRTETAQYATVHLQPYPGEDPTVLSGILRLILSNRWHDPEFCAQFVKPGGLEALTLSVEPFTPEYVEARSGVPAADLVRATEVFARDGRVGAAYTATGPSMAPRSNLSDHLIEAINVVCSRFRRAGDRVRDIAAWLPYSPRIAQVYAPARSFEREESRIRGAKYVGGERLSATLADEILTPGEGQVRALINDGGNPASTLPDQMKAVKALSSLDLLVSIEPYMTNTAKLSHYILPPKLQYERADLPMAIYGIAFYHLPWGQYTPEIVRPPKGAEVVDDWYVYWSIARRLGKQMVLNGVPLDMQNAPTTEELLAIPTKDSVVPLDVIKQYPSGKVFDIEQTVEPTPPGASGRFDLMPDDVAADLAEVWTEGFRDDGKVEDDGNVYDFRLAVRRIRDIVNTSGQALPGVRKRNSFNPVWMNPDDIAESGLADGTRVEVVSAHGRIPGIIEGDATVRRGVVQMNHGWGNLPGEKGDYTQVGSNTNLLISVDRAYEPINAMVRMSAIPVNIVPVIQPVTEPA